MLQHEGIKRTFQVFYSKIDNAVEDKKLSDLGNNFEQQRKKITEMQY